MRMTPDHFNTLREAIHTADNTFPSIREDYEKGAISAKRFRWDLLWASPATSHVTGRSWITENLYPYLNDDHIDTALRKITGTK